MKRIYQQPVCEVVGIRLNATVFYVGEGTGGIPVASPVGTPPAIYEAEAKGMELNDEDDNGFTPWTSYGSSRLWED